MKNGITNAFLLLFSIVLSLLITEALARMIIKPRTSPIGHGILHRKFQMENVILNSDGYRDLEFSKKLKNASNIIFIGDSFTFGHGVANNENFPNRVREGLFPEYETYNFGVSGTNTLDHLKILKSKLASLNREVKVVVYQYVGNDIDYMAKINIMPVSSMTDHFLIWLSNYSYLADYIYQPYLINAVIGDNLWKIYQAYNEKMNNHLMDVEKIWDEIHKNNSPILFIIFPIYIDEHSLNQSQQIYVRRLIERFSETCKQNDGLINVFTLITQHSMVGNRDYWMANRIDPHPSAELHQLVANEIVNYIQQKPGNFMRCGEINSALSDRKPSRVL